MNLTFKVAETPRVYVERIDITGNTTTRDKVIRREFRVNEGDAFNAHAAQAQPGPHPEPRLFPGEAGDQADRGLGPDRVVLGVNVEEKPTGQLSLSGGYSSLERFVIQLAVARTISWARASRSTPASTGRAIRKSISAGFTEPYFMDKPILLGGPGLPPRLQQLQLSSATSATRPMSRSAPAARSAPASRSPNIGASAAATA